MVTLKSYQLEAIECIKESFKTKNKQYVELPTGSGKTILFLYYAQQYAKKILIIVPSRQLQDQVYSNALIFFNKKEISRKGNNRSEKVRTLHICVTASIKGDYLEELAKESFDLIIIDEAHHAQSDSYLNFIDRRCVLYPDSKILGVTATPERSDGLSLDDVLDTCSFRREITDMIEQGYLSDIEGFSVKTGIDISDVTTGNGDFNISSLYKKLSSDSRNNLIIDLYQKGMRGRKVLIFCINIAHSKEINKLLTYNGISSSHIDGSMSPKERNSILHAFHNGEIECLCNCQLLTEGFDEPSIDGIILARPTISKGLFLQMIGRGLRLFNGKDTCKIIDIVDNHKNLKGFGHLINKSCVSTIDKFDSFKDIVEFVEKETLRLNEIKIEKVNFFFEKESILDVEALECMVNYLKNHNIYFQQPITIDEASFLIWYNEFNNKVKNGKYKS